MSPANTGRTSPGRTPPGWPPAGPPQGPRSPGRATSPRPLPGRQPPGATGSWFADRQGLTAAGAILVLFAITLFGAIVDAAAGSDTDPTLRSLFTLCFILGCALAILLVRPQRVAAVMVAPPLAYAAAAAISGAIHASNASEPIVKQGGIDAITSLVTHAPTLLALTGLTILAGVLRVAARRRRRPVASARRS